MTSAWIVAPRARACSSSSSTTTPAPSPMTKPSRSASQGRLAACGSLPCLVDSALHALKPAMPISQIGASAPPAHHHVRVVERDEPRRVADGVRARGAGGDDRVVRAAEAVADADLPRDEVDERARHEEGGDPPGSALVQQHGRLGDGLEPPDARPDEHAGPQQALLVVGRPPGVPHGLVGGGDAVEDEVVDLAAVLRRHHRVGIEGALRAVAGHLAGVGRGVPRGVEPRDRPGARTPLQKARPRRGDPGGQGAHHAHSRNHDPPHGAPPGSVSPHIAAWRQGARPRAGMTASLFPIGPSDGARLDRHERAPVPNHRSSRRAAGTTRDPIASTPGRGVVESLSAGPGYPIVTPRA